MERMFLIAAVGSVTALFFRAERREFSVIVGVVTAVLLLLLGIDAFTGVGKTFEKLCASYGVSSTVLSAVLKILGLSYLTDFGVGISRDAGQSAIASNLELCGRIMILSCVLPSAIALLETSASLLKEVIP
jgi:stage III sporulation protein AD